MQLNKKNALIMAAAMTGLVAGTAARSNAAPLADNTQGQVTVKQSNAAMGKIAVAKPVFAAEDKHSCKGKNDCKGQGGCKAGDNGCKGKNSCKGKGGCATDGSKAPELV
jgi:hypothetical protein